MKILVIGSGGREHALVWKIKQSPKVSEIFAVPGNGGTTEIATNVNIKDTNIEELVKFAHENKIDLTVVGPEVPLAMGIVDEFQKNNLRIFGPSKKAARIEGSKAWTKGFLQKYKIPCGSSETFNNRDEAFAYANNLGLPVVLKADGLAAGKGVLICKTKEDIEKGLDQILVDKAFGDAGNQIVIEEFLEGIEVSVLAFTDGVTLKLMVPTCDYKRALDNDEGLNTGGMGVYSPPMFYNQNLENKIVTKILAPTLEALKKEKVKYQGVLYAGIILTSEGPKLLEYNCRFGDPETQVVLPRLKTDLIDIFNAVIDEKLDKIDVEWDKNCCLGVVLASGGYPEKYKTGFEIKGLRKIEDTIIFHAGTKKRNGKIITNGGRVLCVTNVAESISKAREKTYNKIAKINFKNMHFRKDIGLREIT